ncbi:MAG TPA: bifunctional ADP-dependent NAD(P)H-hydrate dehydratase/NAD(P)H-hydrate epimerase, partial [Thermoplasmata archaeon]|nr:bifunctional ADP-dependent NAD(P)H-hydrate dehydratase/NAD(P)H-hydrate epimerase [Thermoplasmata archaeon]
GGDGCAAAHYLRQLGHAPEIWRVAVAEIRSAPARRCFERAAKDSPVHRGVPTAATLAEFPLVIDAILGAGHRAPLRPEYAAAVHAIRASGAPTLSIDTPTGLEDPQGLTARWTVALTAPKAEVPADRAGEVVVRDIGIPPSAWTETGPGEFLAFDPAAADPVPPRGGRIVVVGGGPYAGAPALVGLAALRCGAERATLLVPERAFGAVQGFAMDLVVRSVGGTHFAPTDVTSAWTELQAGPVAAVVAGPGAGHDPGTVDFFRELLPSIDFATPLVVDADALPALFDEGDRPLLAGRPVLATPNAGELRRLLATHPALALDPAAEGSVPALARILGVTLVAKGPEDRIEDGTRSARNRHHPRSMAVAGSGDVLSGVLGALLARGLSPWEAARLGTYWAGEAGHRVAATRGPGLLATDLLEALAPVGRAGLDRVRTALAA